MEKGRNGWVTLGSRNRNRRQRRRKTSKQTEQNQSSELPKSKQSANTPPPMAFPASERKVATEKKPTFTNEEKEISKILNRALEVSAKRALKPIPRQVDPIPNHRSPMAVKTRDYPKKGYWKGKTKTTDSKNVDKETSKEQASCGSSVVSDSSSHNEVNNISKIKSSAEKIKIEWIYELKTKPGKKKPETAVAATTTTPEATQEKKPTSWPSTESPVIKRAASMPNLNPNAPCFKANPFAQFKSFTPRAPTTISWQPMSHQNVMPQWGGEYQMFNSFPCRPPQQIQHNGINNENRDSVSNLLVPYSGGSWPL